MFVTEVFLAYFLPKFLDSEGLFLFCIISGLSVQAGNVPEYIILSKNFVGPLMNFIEIYSISWKAIPISAFEINLSLP